MALHKIAVFDYKIRATNPIGGCHLRMLRDLSGKFSFTVFAVEFDNPCPERIEWVRIPAPTRPLALLFLVYHVLAPICYLLHCWRRGVRFDLLQGVESNLSFGTVSYSQFCHRAYLRNHWNATRASGVRGYLRWLDHWLHAVVEPWIYRRVAKIVVPSQGLAAELVQEYPFALGKVVVVPNPVDIARMARPENFERERFRAGVGAAAYDTLLVFAALGHFERKGLPMVLEAMTRHGEELKLVVVGGEPALVSSYRARAASLGLGNRVHFAGMQTDLRPFLWAADAFVFPSAYETFSLVAVEAAAAGTPVILTRFHGMGDFIQNGENGILTERSVDAIAAALAGFAAMTPQRRLAMGRQAQTDVDRFRTENFSREWHRFYGAYALG